MIFFLGALFSSVLALGIIVFVAFTAIASLVGFLSGGAVYLKTKNVNDWKAVWTLITTVIVVLGFISLIAIL